MTIEELREKVARAIWEQMWDESFPPPEGTIDHAMIFNQADAAVLAILDGIRDMAIERVVSEPPGTSYTHTKMMRLDGYFIDALKAQIEETK